jgi:hypothetical protein
LLIYLKEGLLLLAPTWHDGGSMQRVALATGGTRSIGHAILVALNEAGHRISANYVGHDEAAQGFMAAAGIADFKFDAADFEVFEAGLQDAPEEWQEVIATSAFNHSLWSKILIRMSLFSFMTASAAAISFPAFAQTQVRAAIVAEQRKSPR